MLLTAYRAYHDDKSRQSYIQRTVVHELLQEEFGNLDASLAESFVTTEHASMRPGDSEESPAPWKVAVMSRKGKGKGGKATREDRQTSGLASSTTSRADDRTGGSLHRGSRKSTDAHRKSSHRTEADYGQGGPQP